MSSYDDLNIKDQIIRTNTDFQGYETQLSSLLKRKDFSDFKETDLHIDNAQHAREIFKIIQQINKKKQALNSKPFVEIVQKYREKMNESLNMGQKTTKDLRNECSNEKCEFKSCEPLKRIDIVLVAYKLFIQQPTLWDKVAISSIIKINGKYTHQQLADDFLHVQIVHCQLNQKLESIRKKFKEKHKCKNVAECLALRRHYRDRHQNEEEERSKYERNVGTLEMNFAMKIKYEKDAVLQQECDKIHAYFIHEIYGDAFRYNPQAGEETETKENSQTQQENKMNVPTPMRRQKSRKNILPLLNQNKKPYIGQKEDEDWFSVVEQNDNSQHETYFRLLARMGVFRWQTAHGFRVGENRAIGHLKKKYSNVKEETLNNIYHPLTKDNWNQTLRKSKIFYQSWAKHKISTEFKGYFDDKVSGNYAEWKKGDEITLQQIVMLKLYTDFDKLQFALKKCFRSENIRDIMCRNQTDEEKEHIWDPKQMQECKKNQLQQRKDLEQRIREFFHWRSGLMIVLNKFGSKLSSKKNMILYHGVNSKMIIKPTATFGFFGPLSTTTSPHVARTFATAKGMVLKIASYFPNLNYCTAFNASLISDYPEEQEWLVGFMYVRILEVRTRKLIDNPQSWKDIIKKVPMASWLRVEFFAIHLFRKQMFSMSEHLERMQAQYLRANRYECCKNKQKYKNKYKDYQIEDFSWEDRLNCLCYFSTDHRSEDEIKEFKEKISKCHIGGLDKNFEAAVKKKMQLYPLFWKRFEHFRKYPNKDQSITFDNISDILKRFFMEPTEQKDIETGQAKWVISFDEIITVYPNVKEVHFVNNYQFDDFVLKKLIKQIQKKQNELRKVTFSYYNYEINDNDIGFKNPKDLDKNILNSIPAGWKIKYDENNKIVHKIIIKKQRQ